MTEKFPHLVKKMGIQIHVPNIYIKTHEIKFSKTTKKSFKSSKKKERSYIQGNIIRLSTDFSTRIFRPGRNGIIYSKYRKKININKNSIPSKVVFQKQRRDKDFPKQAKVEGVHYHLIRNTNGSSLSGSKRTLVNIIKILKGSINIIDIDKYIVIDSAIC